jgi:hypothetical protein
MEIPNVFWTQQTAAQEVFFMQDDGQLLLSDCAGVVGLPGLEPGTDRL